MSRKPSKPGKIVSLLALSELLAGFTSRGTLTKWANDGTIPSVSRPDENGVGEWQFNVPDVLHAIIDVQSKAEVEKIVPVPNDADLEIELNPLLMDEKTAKRRRAIWDAMRAKASALLRELELQREIGKVIDIDLVGAIVEPQLRAVREGFLDLGPRVAGKIADPEMRTIVSDLIYDESNTILAELTADQELADRGAAADREDDA